MGLIKLRQPYGGGEVTWFLETDAIVQARYIPATGTEKAIMEYWVESGDSFNLRGEQAEAIARILGDYAFDVTPKGASVPSSEAFHAVTQDKAA